MKPSKKSNAGGDPIWGFSNILGGDGQVSMYSTRDRRRLGNKKTIQGCGKAREERVLRITGG